MTSLSSQLQQTASHLRLHKSLDLHLFDRADRLIGTIPLLDRMVTIYYLLSEDGSPLYKVTEDEENVNLNYQVRIPLKRPASGSDYFDGLASRPGIQHGQWHFNIGFKKDPDDLRVGTLDGIGIVDIADISIGPTPISIAREEEGWFRRLLRRLFGTSPEPKDTGEIVGIPNHFPSTNSLMVRLNVHFHLPENSGGSGPVPLRMGAFLGHESHSTTDNPYVVICAHPEQVSLQSDLLNTGI
jgi:hypothetical protein